MSEYILKKRYENWRGVDLLSTDLVRPIEMVKDMKNANYRRDRAIEKRPGYKRKLNNVYNTGLSYGVHLQSFNYVNRNNILERQRLLFSGRLHRVVQKLFSLSYSGASAPLVNFCFDVAQDQYVFDISIDGVSVYNKLCGGGFSDELTPVTVSTLVTEINAITGFTAAFTGVSSTPAATLDNVRDHDLVENGQLLLACDELETVPYYDGSTTYTASFNQYALISSVATQNVLMFASPAYPTAVYKYDGNRFYASGIGPFAGTINSTTSGGAGSMAPGVYKYAAQIEYRDAGGNLVQSQISAETTHTLVGPSNSINVAFTRPSLSDLYPYGIATTSAVVTGASTINVTAGHTILAGDYVFIYDTALLRIVEARVTGVNATQLFLNTSVTMGSGDLVSTLNLRFYRSTAGGVELYIVRERPTLLGGTSNFIDTLADASLGAQYIAPEFDPGRFPTGIQYLTTYNGLTIAAGTLAAIGGDDSVHFSTGETPFSYEAGTTLFEVPTAYGDVVTGIAPLGDYLIVFKTRSTHLVSGDLLSGNFRVEELSGDVGCVSHASIQNIKGSLVWLSDRGPYTMTPGGRPEPLGGGRIEPWFNLNQYSGEALPQLTIATSFNDRISNRYLLFVPCISTEAIALPSVTTRIIPNSNSVTWVFDYEKGAWLKWQGFDFSGGMIESAGALFGVHSLIEDVNNGGTLQKAVVPRLFKVNQDFDASDFIDHEAAIEFDHPCQWESMGEPSILKRFLRVNVYTDNQTPFSEPTLTVKIENNYESEQVNAEFDLPKNKSGYANAPWGDSFFESNKKPKSYKLNNGRIRSARAHFVNNNKCENIEILGYEFEVAMINRTGVKP